MKALMFLSSVSPLKIQQFLFYLYFNLYCLCCRNTVLCKTKILLIDKYEPVLANHRVVLAATVDNTC